MFYLLGSAISDNDLKRASIWNATACFILANKRSSDPSQIDAENILRVFSVRNFSLAHKSFVEKRYHHAVNSVKQFFNKKQSNRFKPINPVKIFVQLLIPSNKEYMQIAGANVVISVVEMKMVCFFL